MNNMLEGINSKINEAEKWTGDMEDRMLEITAWKGNIEKRMKINEDNLRDFWDNIKCTNSRIIEVPEGEERKDLRKIFVELIAKNFINMGKEMVKQVQEASTESLRHNKPKEEHTKTHSNQKDKKLR